MPSFLAIPELNKRFLYSLNIEIYIKYSLELIAHGHVELQWKIRNLDIVIKVLTSQGTVTLSASLPSDNIR